jgi:prepilin-type processing-associated H-X9-DG protein
MVPLEAPGTPPANAFVPGGSTIWWPDLLRSYLPAKHGVDCPSVTGTNQSGIVQGAPSRFGNGRFGIGLNHIEFSYSPWAGPLLGTLKISSVKNPSESLVFADAGKLKNPAELQPDKWTEIPGAQLLYFLTPNHPDYAANNPYRVVNRHRGLAMMTWADGHSSGGKVSKIGFQYYPGRTAEGEVARGDAIIGTGNNKWDPRWQWDRE